MAEAFSSIDAALFASVESSASAVQDLQLRVHVVQLLGRGRTVAQQILHAPPLGPLLGDLLAQCGRLLGYIRPFRTYRGTLPLQLEPPQVKLYGVDLADLLSGRQQIALFGIEAEDASRGFGRHRHFRGLERPRGVEVPAAVTCGQQKRCRTKQDSFHRFIVCFSS